MKVCASNNNQTIKIILFVYIGLVQPPMPPLSLSLYPSLSQSLSLSINGYREEAGHVQKLRLSYDERRRTKTDSNWSPEELKCLKKRFILSNIIYW